MNSSYKYLRLGMELPLMSLLVVMLLKLTADPFRGLACQSSVVKVSLMQKSTLAEILLFLVFLALVKIFKTAHMKISSLSKFCIMILITINTN
jgi:hypothetical protein